MDKALENIQINDYNNRRIVIATKAGTPLRVQFPRMYMPFGVSGFVPEIGPTKYNIDFAIKGFDEDSYMKKLRRHAGVGRRSYRRRRATE